MRKILRYSFYDLIRSRWTVAYFAFFALLSCSFLLLNNDGSKLVISLMNVVLALIPLVGICFGVMYYYNSREFIELLLAQPIKRRDIFLGQFLGIGISLSLSVFLGMTIPFLFTGIHEASIILSFATLQVIAVVLSFIFSGIGYYIAMKNENKIKGFGIAILIWLFLVIIYDGIFLIALSIFSEYPLDNYALAATLMNPIDLSRILITLQLDISAMMGYTGAIFKKFFGSNLGIFFVGLSLMVWFLLPALGIRKLANTKDF